MELIDLQAKSVLTSRLRSLLDSAETAESSSGRDSHHPELVHNQVNGGG